MINLKAFILSLWTVVIGLMTAFFYFEANKVLGQRFDEIDAIHSKAVTEYARTVIDARKYLLTAYREDLDPSNRLAKDLLVANGKRDFTMVKAALKKIQARTKCDVVDLLNITDGDALFHRDLTKAFRGAPGVREGKPAIVVSEVHGHLALLSFSPLMLFQYPAGIAVLGFYLNGELSHEVSAATNTEVSFAVTRSANSGASRIPIGDSGGAVELIARNPVMAGITRGMKKEVLAIGAGSLLLITVLIYLVLHFGFLRSFREILKSISESAEELDRNIIVEKKARRFPIREVTTLSKVFAKFLESLGQFQRRIKLKTQTEAAGKVVSIVAHDLNRVAGALYMELEIDKEEMSEKKRRALYSLATRVKGMTGTVIARFRKRELEAAGSEPGEDAFLPSAPPSVEMLALLVDSIVAEKTALYWDRKEVKLEQEIDPNSYNVFVEIHPDEFKRALSSLVDNAVESIAREGVVSFKVWGDEKSAFVRISDTGCGIPKERLERLGERGESSRHDGTGTGFWDANELVRYWRGEIGVESKVGIGTSVEVRIPRSRKESAFLPELVIEKGITLVILDDDASIHTLWEERLARAGILDVVNVIHFENAEKCLVWWRTQGRNLAKRPIVLCDYEFKCEDWNGLQVIDQMGIDGSSVLVTGFFEKKDVQDECARLGVKILPKTIIPFFKLTLKKSLANRDGIAKGGAL